MDEPARRADYGIDAPGVVRNLAIAGLAVLLLPVLVWCGVLPRELVLRPSSAVRIDVPLVPTGLFSGAGFCATALWMLYGSRYGKTDEREKLLDHVRWRGDERVLDVGCGRGLVLVGAAKRLRSGLAAGVDLWQAEDLSGNRAGVPLQNAAIEGVAARVRVCTADMQRLPFAGASFDVVTSRAAIHNLYSAPARAAAIREIARVLKPGAQAVIADIRHLPEYVRLFAEAGCRDVRLVDSRILSALCTLVTMGSLRPNTLLVRKPA